MINEKKLGNVRWIDLEKPKRSHIRNLVSEFEIDPVVAEELLSPTMHSKVDIYKDYIYVIMHFPTFNQKPGTNNIQEIDFVVSKDFIITAHYREVKSFHQLAKLGDVDDLKENMDISATGGILFYRMLEEIYGVLTDKLDEVADNLNEIERELFADKEEKQVIIISKVAQKILDFKRAIIHHRDIYDSFRKPANSLLGENYDFFTRSLMNKHNRLLNTISTNMETITELRETNATLVSTKQNEIMKFLTIMAFITFPLSLLASIFGMNTDYLPIVGWDNDFWIIITAMLVGTLCFLLFFKFKKWL